MTNSSVGRGGQDTGGGKGKGGVDAVRFPAADEHYVGLSSTSDLHNWCLVADVTIVAGSTLRMKCLRVGSIRPTVAAA